MYHRQFGALAGYGQDTDIPLVTGYWLADPPTAAEGGYANRLTGDHPPKKPISYLEWSIIKRSGAVAADYAPGGSAAANVPENIRLEVLAANQGVVDALRDSKIPRFLASYQTCLKMGRADASATDKASFNFYCKSWKDQIDYRLRTLDEALRRAAPFNAEAADFAEVVVAEADQFQTIEEASSQVLSDPDCNWWCQVQRDPKWRRVFWWSAGLLVAGLTLPFIGSVVLARASRPQPQTVIIEREGQSNLSPIGW